MSLSKKQKDFLKTIENPKDKKHQKQQFKLQNKFYKFGLVEEIIFIDGIFKTDNPELIAFLNECPMVEKIEENSLTKESLRDITEPKAESLINKEAPKGKNILSEDLLFSENKKLDISIEVFIKDCEKWLLHDLDFGTCIGIKNRCVSFKQFELASKFRDKEIQILSKFDEEKLNSFLQQGFIDLNTMIQVKKMSKTNNSEVPKEFCVEITEENKEVLELIFREKYKSNNWSLRVKDFLHSDIKFDSLYSSNKAPDNNVNIEIVLTEEFLRYIGKEELIGKSVSEKTHKQNMLEKEINEYFNLMIDEVNNGNDYSPLLQLIEICCKKLLHLSNPVLAVGKINETTDAKPLDFDLPKKENPIQNIECLSINDIIDSGVLIVESPLYQNLKKYLIELVEKKTNPFGLK